MPLQTVLRDTTPAGLQILTINGLAGTLTTRSTEAGDRIVVGLDSAWVPVPLDTLIAIADDQFDSTGQPIWGAGDGCPLGTREMGCDLVPGCIGECGSALPTSTLVSIDDPEDPLGMPAYSGEVAAVARTLTPGLYAGMTLWSEQPVFVVVTETGAYAHRRA